MDLGHLIYQFRKTALQERVCTKVAAIIKAALAARFDTICKGFVQPTYFLP